MTPDIKLATTVFAPRPSGPMKSESGPATTFADALGDKRPQSIEEGSSPKDSSKSVMERLQAALLASLKDADSAKIDTEHEDKDPTSLLMQIDGEPSDEDAVPPADPDSDPDEDDVLAECAQATIATQPPHAGKREKRLAKDDLSRLAAAGGAARGHSASSGETQSEQLNRVGSGMNLPENASANSSGGAAISEAKAQHAHRGGSEQLVDDDNSDQPHAAIAKAAKRHGIATAQQEPAAQTSPQANVQIQLVTADTGPAPTQAIVETIKAEPSWSAYFRDTGSSPNQPIQSLKIQLHPAELGTVTAHMRAAGDALEVEITADTVEAHKHLTAEADEILRSLRQVGVDVDRITVHLADNGTSADAKNSSGEQWRDFSSFSGQERREGGTSQKGNGSSRNSGDGGLSHQIAESRQNPAAGRYI